MEPESSLDTKAGLKSIVPDADHHLVLKRVDEVAAIAERFLAG